MRYPVVGDNLTTKFDGQIKAFEDLGFNVHYFLWDNKTFYLKNRSEKRLFKAVKFSGFYGYNHTKVFYDLYSCAKSLIETDKFEFVYIRGIPLGCKGYKLLKTIHKKHIKTVVEIPTYIANGREKHLNIIRALVAPYFRMFQKLSMRYVTLFTLIGDKTTGLYRGRPAINISNGIDVSRYPDLKRRFEESVINIVAVSSMANWHGYERIINGIANYTSGEHDYKVNFYLVGDGVIRNQRED